MCVCVCAYMSTPSTHTHASTHRVLHPSNHARTTVKRRSGVAKMPRKLPNAELKMAAASLPPAADVRMTAEDTGGGRHDSTDSLHTSKAASRGNSSKQQAAAQTQQASITKQAAGHTKKRGSSAWCAQQATHNERGAAVDNAPCEDGWVPVEKRTKHRHDKGHHKGHHAESKALDHGVHRILHHSLFQLLPASKQTRWS